MCFDAEEVLDLVGVQREVAAGLAAVLGVLGRSEHRGPLADDVLGPPQVMLIEPAELEFPALDNRLPEGPHRLAELVDGVPRLLRSGHAAGEARDGGKVDVAGEHLHRSPEVHAAFGVLERVHQLAADLLHGHRLDIPRLRVTLLVAERLVLGAKLGEQLREHVQVRLLHPQGPHEIELRELVADGPQDADSCQIELVEARLETVAGEYLNPAVVLVLVDHFIRDDVIDHRVIDILVVIDAVVSLG